VPDPSNPSSVRFGPFALDVSSGELRSDDLGGQVAERLPPQPARLLAHLIARAPDLVSRDEIRELLWPDVEVEFEESLHSCIRKIRLALGDSATTPQYIETVPRRGYRFIGASADAAAPDARPLSEANRSRPRVLVAVLAVVAVIVAAGLGYQVTRGPETAVLRIAVMPSPQGAAGIEGTGGGLAEAIVRLLMDRAPAVEVIGPTTTERFVGRIRMLLVELQVDYVVNMREAPAADGGSTVRLLIEIIRSSDGAHAWVRYLDELPAGGAAAAIVEAATLVRQ
jgi:DNA-binding winged helix-turn-helix (wHTH) protein